MAGIVIDLNMAKTLGLKESDFNGKSNQEQLKILDEGFTKYKAAIEIQSQKAYFDNAVNVLSKVKELFKTPTSVYVKAVGQKKTESIVEIVGYSEKNKKVFVINPESLALKVFTVDESDIIKSGDELLKVKEERKARKKPKGKK